MPCIHIIEGPVGAGKTTYANLLATRCRTAPLVLDDWMANLFRPDRPDGDIWPWYAERKARLTEQILCLAIKSHTLGSDAIVELGLLRFEDRLRVYERLTFEDCAYQVHVLDLPRDTRWDRVQARNRDKGSTFAMEVPENVFTIASDMWEPPGPEERAAHPMLDVADSKSLPDF